MINYILEQIKKLELNPDFLENAYFKFLNFVTEFNGSLAYSWNEENIHFVQLKNYPLFKKSWNNYVLIKGRRIEYNIKDSLEWLEHDLFDARKLGKVIILNFNNAGQNWEEGYTKLEEEKLRKKFIDIINKYEVSAIFVGNDHKKIVKSGNIGGIPTFYSGSIPQKKYLLVKFSRSKIIVNLL